MGLFIYNPMLSRNIGLFINIPGTQYLGLPIDLIKSRVLDESLSVFNQSSVWRIILLYYAITTEWEIYTNIKRKKMLQYY